MKAITCLSKWLFSEKNEGLTGREHTPIASHICLILLGKSNETELCAFSIESQRIPMRFHSNIYLQNATQMKWIRIQLLITKHFIYFSSILRALFGLLSQIIKFFFKTKFLSLKQNYDNFKLKWSFNISKI